MSTLLQMKMDSENDRESLSECAPDGDAVRPVVTFTPHWKIIYEGDTVTMSCDVEAATQYIYYLWYKNSEYIGKYFQNYTITSAEETDGGDYRCRAVGGGDYSLPARLHVISEGSAERPFVTVNPNWRKIFVGERVTITCDTGSTARGNQRYYWYKYKVILYEEKQRDITITSAALEHSGEYRCRAGSGDVSFPVRLEVSSGSIILQAPPNVYEGNTLTLRCRCRSPYYNEKKTVFHIGSTDLQSQQPMLDIPNVNTTMTGMYGCTRKVGGDNRTDETFISIQELFSYPEIKLVPTDIITEGGSMTLTCNTVMKTGYTLQHQFAFYRDERIVQDFSASTTYSVPSAQPVHSGKYTCEVRDPTGGVRKRSEVLSVQIDDVSINHSLRNTIRLALSACVLVILSCILFCHMETAKQLRNISVPEREIQRMSTDDTTVPA
ncbi:Fc receptor-like protein 4 isoform X5 [Pseudophryne corroboree]|uniref:Fc receptor-like protein 4 isoform X5 n=1 Tax=Pseudophryne corroboree TaxID=495146 RepID=UPI003081BE9B